MKLGLNGKTQSSVWLLAALALASCSSTKSIDSESDLDISGMSDAAALGSDEDTLSLDGQSAAAVIRDHERAQYKGSRFPKIAASPFQVEGYWMNSYHFVRGSESWEELSRLIYDREDRASLLASWNPEVALGPGTLIYYNSPFPARASDSKVMKSLAQDFGIPTQRVVVEAGQWLSTIAGERYGHVEGWREIASLNQSKLNSPDRLEVGTELEVLPVKLNTKDILRPVVEKVAEIAQVAQYEQNLAAAGTTEDISDENLERELDQATAASTTNSATPTPGTSLAVGAGSSMISKIKNAVSAQMHNILLALSICMVIFGTLFFVRRRKKSKSSEKEITLNMDILEKTGTSRGGVSSIHPMN